MSLPKRIGEWTRPDAARRVAADTIFDYMDGAGELYLAYAFDHLDACEYKAPDASLGTILVEIYSMRSVLDAFGLLSTDWTGEPVALGPPPGPTAPPRLETVPPHHALFGAGLLRLWTGSLYARILASRDTPVARDAVLAIGRAIATGRGDTVPPGFLASVPATTAGWPRPGAKTGAGSPIRADRTCFFRSHLVLNSQYFLASEDILGLGPGVAAITTEYAPSRAGARPTRLMVIRYPTPAAASAGLETFQRAYLPEGGRTGGAGQGATRTEHGWLAWAIAGPAIAIALDADDLQAARGLVSQAVHPLQTDVKLQ